MSERQPPPGTPVDGPSRGHEQSDLRPRAIGIFLLVLALTIVGVLLVSMWLYDYSAGRLARTQPSAPLTKPIPPPGPHLQVAPTKEMGQLRRAEDAILARYGWIDRPTGVVRIPIDRAIQLLAERGLPASGTGAKRAKSR